MRNDTIDDCPVFSLKIVLGSFILWKEGGRSFVSQYTVNQEAVMSSILYNLLAYPPRFAAISDEGK